MSKKARERRNRFEMRNIYAKCGFFNFLRAGQFDYIRHRLLVERLLKLGKNENSDELVSMNLHGHIVEVEARVYANWIRNKGWEGFSIEDGCRLFNKSHNEIMEWVTVVEKEYNSGGLFIRHASSAIPVNISAIHNNIDFDDENPFQLKGRKIHPPYDSLFLDFGQDVELRDDGGGTTKENVGVYLVTDRREDEFHIYASFIISNGDNYELPFVVITSNGDDLTIVNNDTEGHFRDQINNVLNSIFFALELMNCRNIVFANDTDDEVVRQMYERQFGMPMTRYKTLAIRPLSGNKNTESISQPYQGVMPLHLRRGNFATYSDDRPLFGKYTGTFWRPATAVGERKNGVVIKDYEVQL